MTPEDLIHMRYKLDEYGNLQEEEAGSSQLRQMLDEVQDAGRAEPA